MALNDNNRIFWAIQAVGLAGDGETSYTEVHGLQSVGITTTFNLEQVFEIGQIEIYENIEDVPDIELTLEKVIDGYPLIYHLATPNATSASLTGRSTDKAIATLSIFGEEQDSASGTPNSQVVTSGLYVSNLSYTFPVDGNSTESVTLVGNNKVWKTSSFTFSGSIFDNTDEPLAVTSGTGGVQRRENIVFGSTGTVSLLPTEINGIDNNGHNLERSDGNGNKAHVQSISVSTDLGREALTELGTKAPFFRPITFPVEVTTEIEILTSDGDLIDAEEDKDNLSNETIKIVLDEGLVVDTGSNNKLSSISYGGADAGGGNATTTFSYTTFNKLDVTHDQDPAGL